MKVPYIVIVLLLTIAPLSGFRQIDVSELPSGATEFLKRHFANSQISKVRTNRSYGENGYKVVLTDKTEIRFWNNGKWREVNGRKKPIPTAFIDERIKAYTTENYPNNKITRIDYGPKNIEVNLTERIKLKFDKANKTIVTK